MRFWMKIRAILLGILICGGAQRVLAQTNFYEGKTVRFIVGFSGGGGYDTYTRLVARHMGRHVPGNPIFMVDNMAGARSMISASHICKDAKPERLTIGQRLGVLF